MLPIAEARKRRTPIDWATTLIDTPSFLGRRIIDNQPLEELVPLIDWSPFFHTWELRGRFPGIFDDPYVGKQGARTVRGRAKLLQDIVNGKLLRARAVYGFYPANSVGDDIELYTDESRTEVLATFPMLRQQAENPPGSSTMLCPTTSRPKRATRRLPWRVRGDDRPRHGRVGGAVHAGARRLQIRS